MTGSETSAAPKPAQNQTVYWVIAILLAVIATSLWVRPGNSSWLPAALAQNQPLAGARGVFAFTGPIDRDQYGLFMLDVDQGTVWCYAFDVVGGTRKLRLIAARTWIYDRYLQDFNSAEPDFREIQKLVNQQRQQASIPTAPTDAEPRVRPADGPRPPGS
jgi:hypothetical protein